MTHAKRKSMSFARRFYYFVFSTFTLAKQICDALRIAAFNDRLTAIATLHLHSIDTEERHCVLLCL